MNKDNLKLRESNFELLRLIAMLFIVWYHLLCFFVVKIDDAPVYKAMYLPLHVAVICFVLISGYFRIRPSVRGIAKLAFPLLMFYLPLAISELIFDGVGGGKKPVLLFQIALLVYQDVLLSVLDGSCPEFLFSL